MVRSFPDGQVYDPSSNNPNGLLEIKCPYTKRALTPQEACEDPSFYCTIENDKLKLKHEHPYYQVQQQIYVSQDFFPGVIFVFLPQRVAL